MSRRQERPVVSPASAPRADGRASSIPTRAIGAVFGVLCVLAVIVVWAVMGHVAGQPPLPARPESDPFTGYVSGLTDLVSRLSGLVTLGAVAAILWFSPMGAHHRIGPSTGRLRRIVGRSGQVWLWSSLLLSAANAAYVNGVPLVYTLTPRTWWDFVSSTPAAMGWLACALAALVTVVVAYASTSWAAYALAFGVSVLAQTFVAVGGNVSVGLNHDWATDAAIWVSLAGIPLSAAAIAVVLRGGDIAPPDSPATAVHRVARYHKFVPFALPVVVAAHGLIAWQQMAGHPLLASGYGWATLGFFLCFGVLAASWVARQISGAVRVSPRHALISVLPDAVVVVAYAVLRTVANHLPPPRFFIPQSIQVNYLGYQVDIPATAARIASLGRPNLLWVGLAVVALAAYGWGVWRVHAAGRRWPAIRTVFWVAGWLLMLYLATAGLWEYSTVVFSWHMLVHMTVNMLVPVLCLLGGPVSLIQAASPVRPHGQMPGLREATVAVTDYRPLRRVFNPLVLWLLYIGSLYAVYLTPVFPWLMRYHWAHQLMLIWFMVTGYLFFDMVAGVDKVWNLPHIGRLALVIGVMPFHAFFAVAILSANTLLGATFYESIDVGWVGDLMADQGIAGQITWIVGEVPLLIVILALAVQWFQADNRDARRLDRAQDTGLDDSFDAYNDMLTELARRDRDQQPAERRLRP